MKTLLLTLAPFLNFFFIILINEIIFCLVYFRFAYETMINAKTIYYAIIVDSIVCTYTLIDDIYCK